jgi:hypothetical protein
MSDALDDILSQIPKKYLTRPKKLLSRLELAYTVGVPPLLVVPMTDLLNESAGHSFHIGTPDPEMRRIASWIFTKVANDHYRLREIIAALWERNGREDLKLVGLLLANLKGAEGLGNPWEIFNELIIMRRSLALEVVLEIAEEMARGGNTAPEDGVLMVWAQQGKIAHQCAVLVLTLRRDSALPVELIRTAPEGGELFERIRTHLLQGDIQDA